MTSKAEASLICKSFGANLVPDRAPDVGLLTVLKKRADDATLSLAFTDATLRDPRSLAGVVLTAEKPLGGGRVGRQGRRALFGERAASGPPLPAPTRPPLPTLPLAHPQAASRARCPTSPRAATRWAA